MMYIPQSTYRIQFHADFNLESLSEIIDYLHKLGISTVYASPTLEAQVGSSHGYDVINPLKLNPEIGIESSLAKIADELHNREMGWIQDIVPNHMAFSSVNPWIESILELGPRSPFFSHFDVNWWNDRPDNYGKLMLPILGENLDKVLDSKQLKVSNDDQGLALRYFEHRLPLNAHFYISLLNHVIGQASQPESVEILTKLRATLEPFSSVSSEQANPEEWKQFKRLWHDRFFDDEFRLILRKNLDRIEGDSKELRALLDQQFFRLAHWKETESEIYYRRFFTVNDLICLNMQEPGVFEDYHEFLSKLVQENIIQGLRVDHVDGLFDPTEYLQRLRDLVGQDVYLIVEKILEGEENIPNEWPIHGTTGYDFLVQANRFFGSTSQPKKLSQLYRKWHPDDRAYERIVYDNKMLILKERMGGELNNLIKLMNKLEIIPSSNIAPPDQLKEALAHVLVAFPVYRIYDNQLPLGVDSLQILSQVFANAEAHAPKLSSAFDTLRNIFNGVPDKDEETNRNTLYFIQRCQQFSGPLAAKGIEDTTFYQFNRLVSRNEVGDNPSDLSMDTDELHQWLQSRNLLTMNTTATHDTKRGEDARLRINSLSEDADRWDHISQSWKEKHRKYRTEIAGKLFPTDNDLYFIYQTLVGTYPFHITPLEVNYADRFVNYLEKVVREAKANTSWSNPNEEYENSLKQFINAILGEPDFLDEITEFVRPIARKTTTYSLAQTVLKTMSPGIPDIYQGTEFWDLSMVDPDNRRPVDYNARKYLLDQFSEQTDQLETVEKLRSSPDDPAIKMYTLYHCLQLRKKYASLFAESFYQPLVVSGIYSEHILAFYRRHQDRYILTVIPRRIMNLLPDDTIFPLGDLWKDTSIAIPDLPQDFWKNEFTGEIIHSSSGSLPVSAILQHFPVAVLTNQIND